MVDEGRKGAVLGGRLLDRRTVDHQIVEEWNKVCGSLDIVVDILAQDGWCKVLKTKGWLGVGRGLEQRRCAP